MTDEQRKDLQDRAEKFESEDQELQGKHNIKRTITIEFPMYREYPDELKLALSVISKHGPNFKFQYENREEPKE